MRSFVILWLMAVIFMAIAVRRLTIGKSTTVTIFSVVVALVTMAATFAAALVTLVTFAVALVTLVAALVALLTLAAVDINQSGKRFYVSAGIYGVLIAIGMVAFLPK